MMYRSEEWRIIEIKKPVNLAYIKNLSTGQCKFCSKQELSPFMVLEHLKEIKDEGGNQI